ncbi:MAG: heme-binding domain-containing protein [Candidatus Binataceae bacterium]
MIVKPRLSLALLFLLVLLISSCSNSQKMPAPAVTQGTDVSSDFQVNAILENSCYSCHSTGGSAPWYAAISPTYLAASSARRALNFADWQTFDHDRKAAELKSIEQSVSSGSMPPGDYTALDRSARLSDDQKRTLLKWASQDVSAH